MRSFIILPVLIYVAIIFCLPYFNSQKENKKDILDEATAADSIQVYIDSFHQVAVMEMKQNKIPASIKLAQAILESRYGQSELAQYANNHFGMKCDSKYKGNRYNKFSREWFADSSLLQMSCFRCYNSVAENYEAHSDFLRKREFYTELFTYPINDYKAWAHGLQKAGYATDPNYAAKLIALIERFRLHQYDQLIEKD